MRRKSQINKAVLMIVVLIFVVIVVCVLFPVSKIAAIGLEFLSIKSQIDNPHVDADYQHWQPIVLEGGVSFGIPEDWSVHENDGVYAITDSTGNPWAYGTFFGTDCDRFDNYKDFIAEISSTRPETVTYESFTQFIMMDGSTINKLNSQHENIIETYYNIHLFISTQSEFILLVSVDLANDVNQFDIAEALVYSYAFKVYQ